MNSSLEAIAETVDAFHRGRFALVQPKDFGHRSGIDAMILASAVPSGFAGRVADLGAGAGAAGLAVAARCNGVNVALIENNPVMAAFARKTMEHELNQKLAIRLSLIESDVSLTGRQRVAAGLNDNVFDFVMMNPPFNLPGDRQTPDAAKAGAHVMRDGLFDAWLRTAAAIVKPGGGVALIARPQSLGDICNAMAARFGALRIVPVHPREDEAAIRIIITGIKGSRARLSLEPPLVLHGPVGNAFLPRSVAITNGEIGLFDPFRG
jgi:tRNA1(Val) A37 N6-methylase TrmN6